MAASEASPDEQLELKKRARRRLVGATALALLAAIVLPMVMDHEPRPANQDIQVRIPNPESAGSFTPRVVPAAVQPSAAMAQPETKPETKPEPKPETRHEARPETPAPKLAPVPPPAATAAKPAEQPAAKPAEKAAAKTAEKPADSKTEAARAADALNGVAEQWVVQLGAYQEAGNVKLLLSKLKGIGLAAYSEKYDSPQGPRTRVRAGPFPSKEAAEKARVKVRIIGVDGPVAPK